MPLFGSPKQQRDHLEQTRRKAEIENRAKCQREINAILKKYGYVIRAKFELVDEPKQTKQI